MSQGRPRCLIAVTALRYSREFGQAAIASAAAAGEEAVLLFVLDPDVPGAVAGHLAEGGFLGERLMHELRDTMMEEYRERGCGHLEDLEERARAAGVPVRTRVEEGAFVETACDVAAEESATRILAAAVPQSPLARVFLRSETDRLRIAAPCPAEVFGLDGVPAPAPVAPARKA
ncbi:universal stress protein [bacterium]|nr:universal stress protein [bacterium]